MSSKWEIESNFLERSAEREKAWKENPARMREELMNNRALDKYRMFPVDRTSSGTSSSYGNSLNSYGNSLNSYDSPSSRYGSYGRYGGSYGKRVGKKRQTKRSKRRTRRAKSFKN
jgi:hypothetical protein